MIRFKQDPEPEPDPEFGKPDPEQNCLDPQHCTALNGRQKIITHFLVYSHKKRGTKKHSIQ